MPLDQVWNDILQSNFESYIEVRPVTLDELRTRIAAEISAAAGMIGNPFWWDSWETDNHFHFEGPAMPLRGSTPQNIPGSPLRLRHPHFNNDGNVTPHSYASSALSSSPSVAPSLASFKLTKENLERHEKRLSLTKSLSEPKLRLSVSNPTRPGASGRRSSIQRIQSSRSCQWRQIYCNLVSTRELPSELHVAGMTPLVFLTWDDGPEQSDMAWEKLPGLPDPPLPHNVDPEESLVDDTRRSRQSIINLRLMPDATEIALKTKWNPQAEYAYGFARDDVRAHTVEGLRHSCHRCHHNIQCAYADVEFDVGSDLPRVIEYDWFVAYNVTMAPFKSSQFRDYGDLIKKLQRQGSKASDKDALMELVESASHAEETIIAVTTAPTDPRLAELEATLEMGTET